MTTGFVYIIRPRQQVAGDEVIKIGMTTRSVRRRVRELSTGSHAGFDIVYSIRADNARGLERLLHKRFGSFRVEGGGQEFFRVPAQAVVAEVERIAIEVSSERARNERDTEMKSFKDQIGATAAELRISVPLILAFPVIWGYLYYLLVVKIGMATFQHSQWPEIIIAIAAMYGIPLLIWRLGKSLYKILWEEFVKTKFGDRLAEKEIELRVKYPLAYASC